MEVIGLRYFNVFGRRQSPQGAYAAVIPKFIEALIKHESPVINGDGTYSRDFTYVDNVILMNHLAATTANPKAIGQVFNTAAGERTDLNALVAKIKQLLKEYDPEINKVEVIYGPERKGDVPHSMASIEKAKRELLYSPSHNFERGLEEAINWYWNNLK